MNKEKGKKSLTAVSAVVAAGLAPGIAASASASATQPAGTEVEVTAADVVAIDGEVLDFDVLFAATQPAGTDQQPPRRSPDKHKCVYGPPPRVVYGPPPVVRHELSPAQRDSIAKAGDIDAVTRDIMELCAERIDAADNGIVVTPDSNLISDLGMDSIGVVKFVTDVESLYSVQLPDNFLAEPPTPRRLAEQVVKARAKQLTRNPKK
ncbi:MAG: acyl carrier protein [Muribaculaceae bacterium]|nr:acyl carrier protein [Muribaculaceae bacterium]